MDRAQKTERRAQTHPAFVALADNKGLAGLALRKQRIEFLVEPRAKASGYVNECVKSQSWIARSR